MRYITVDETNIESALDIRLEMLKAVNKLAPDFQFDEKLINESRDFLLKGNQTTILAVDKNVIGCATLCYIDMLPTFSHPTGKRAHLMNVYTNPAYRNQGIAYEVVSKLINEAKKKQVTEISLDATQMGRSLYIKLGFLASEECMTLNLC